MDGGIALLDGAHDFLVVGDAVLGGAEHLDQGVNVHAVGGDAVLLGLGHDLVKDLQAVAGGLGNAGIVAQQGHDAPLLVLGLGQDGEDLVHLVAFAGDGVEQTGTAAELVSLHQDVRAGAVHRDGQIGDGLDALDHPLQGLDLFRLGDGSAAVNVGGAGLGLDAGALFDELRVSAGDGVSHSGDGAIDLFADNFKTHVGLTSL